MWDCLTHTTNPCWQVVFEYLRSKGQEVDTEGKWLESKFRQLPQFFRKGEVAKEDPNKLLFLTVRMHACMHGLHA